MSDEPPPPPGGSLDFLVRASYDEAGLVGTRWWNESFQAASAFGFGRRAFLQGSGAPGLKIALGVLGLGGLAAGMCSVDDDDDDDRQIDLDAITLQRREGWDVGSDATLVFQRPVQMDAATDLHYAQHLDGLARALTPTDARLQPFYVPTLFQSLSGVPSSARLRAAMRPVHTEEMQRSFDRGAALAELASRPDAPQDVGLVLDLPGPQSVALAAALSGRFTPVFMFDNWPHPKAVVPAHETLGATIYYRPVLAKANDTRPALAAPVFVLDANRLNPYRDDPGRFDNRYLVNLPSAAQLQGMGIKRLLYIRPDGQSLQELDDLNADFVELDKGGIQVQAVALDDFQKAAQIADGKASVTSSSGTSGGYYYGGHPYHHVFFWNRYGWAPPPRIRTRTTAPALPAPIANRAAYRPVPRPTIFNTRAVGGVSGVGKQKPTGFGRVSVRSGGTGRRSGSFGRSRSSYYG